MNGKLKVYSVLLMLLLATDLLAQEGSGVYVGGHIRRERPNTITPFVRMESMYSTSNNPITWKMSRH